MTAERWERLQEVFGAAAELKGVERAALIEARCGGDEELKRMVESLLHSERSEGVGVEGVVEGAIRSVAGGMEEGEIANFRLIRRLGEGGMGVVYEAEQMRPQRKVAVKLIRAGKFAGERERRLFEREAEALARLAHAGIASIYESGETAAGQPYLVMEFVEGVTLTEYVAGLPEMESLRRGDVGRRIELFLEICEAVSYAHQRGVIHRDLKPANIMVSNGKVKVLDFGLARIETGLEATRTETGVVQGSLRYMSPEQARGESSRIDTRSDVYALGVVLYEMLTGVHPYLDRTDLLGAVYQICETPMRSLRAAKKAFSADLETILSKALAKEPGQRYDGPAGLAADLRRFLANETILARPVTLRYQMGKLIARNKVVSAAVGVIFALVVGFGVIAVQQSVRIAAERDRANQEAATANEVAEFLVRLFRETNPTETDGVLTAKEILLSGRKRLDTELKQKPEIRARLLETIGNSFT
ncbi:MAG: serine/threonine-protein kinase, partial [Acidobacteriota bacterium]